MKTVFILMQSTKKGYTIFGVFDNEKLAQKDADNFKLVGYKIERWALLGG